MMGAYKAKGITMLATEAVRNPTALVRFAAAMYDLPLPRAKAILFLKGFSSCQAEYNLRLSLKHWLIPYCTGRISPRPTAKPDRRYYPFDDYARSPPVTMTSLLSSRGGASPWLTIARNRLEDIGGYTGEIHMILQLERTGEP